MLTLEYRPITRKYVQALEGQIKSLEQFIIKLISVDASRRDEMLASFRPASSVSSDDPASVEPSTRSLSIPIRLKGGHLQRGSDGKATEFYGATSPSCFFNISPSSILDYAQEKATEFKAYAPALNSNSSQLLADLSCLALP
jgi:hypothetical protein